jgi:preprotein translocase subunit SecF
MENKLKILQPMKYWWLYFLISLTVIIPGTYSLIRYGLKPSIDFTGGTTIAWDVAAAKDRGIEVRSIDSVGNTWTITTAPLTKELYQGYKAKIEGAKELSFDTVGPALGGELIKKTIYAIGLAASLIMFYVAYRFKNIKYGVSAILAMLHDSLVVLGVFSLLGHFSGVEVHDTIIVYDRIRELKKKHGYLGFEEIVNRACVETMGRSINNSLTIIFMLFAMYLLGGSTTHWFIFALLIGTISGTYSSTFTAAPILIAWDKFSQRKKVK